MKNLPFPATAFDDAYKLAFKEQNADDLKRRPIYIEAMRNGSTESNALLLARLESLIIASTGSLAAEAQSNLKAIGLMLQHGLNERTSFLTYEVGRLWQSMGRQSVGSLIYDAAAASAIGRSFGLQPRPPVVAPPPFQAIPKATDPHVDISLKPTFGGLSTFSFTADTTVPLVDAGGVIILKNITANPVTFTPGMGLLGLVYATKYAVRPVVSGYVETDASNIVALLNPQDGGTITGVSLQVAAAGAGTLAAGASIKVRYQVQEAPGQ